MISSFAEKWNDVEYLGLEPPVMESVYRIEEVQPDLVFFDVDINQKACFLLIEAIGRRIPDLPIVLLSTCDEFSLIRTAMRCGCRDFLLKPLGEEEFDRVITHFHPLKEKMLSGIYSEEKYFRNETEDKRDYNCYWQIMRAKALIDHKVHEKISLEEIAQEIYMSPFYFSRMFKAVTGLNFSDYVLNKKIEKAMEYLKNSNLTIEEIGLMVGYEESNSFRRMFKKKVGQSPREFRKKWLNDG